MQNLILQLPKEPDQTKKNTHNQYNDRHIKSESVIAAIRAKTGLIVDKFSKFCNIFVVLKPTM